MKHCNHIIQITYALLFLWQPYTCMAMDDSQQIWQFNDTETSVAKEKTVQDTYLHLSELAKINQNLFRWLYANTSLNASSTPPLSEIDYQYLQSKGFLTPDKTIPTLVKALIKVMVEPKTLSIVSYEQLKKQGEIELIQEGGLITGVTVARLTIITMYKLLNNLLDECSHKFENFHIFESLVNLANDRSVDFTANEYWKGILKRLIELNFVNSKAEFVSPLVKKLVRVMTIFDYNYGEIRVRTFEELKAKGFIRLYDNRTIQEVIKKNVEQKPGSDAEIRTQDLRIMIPSL